MNCLILVVLLTTVNVGEVFGSIYHGPTALPEILQNGYLADTHDVAAAKSAHLATLSHQSHGGSHDTQHGHHGDLRYHGPIAVPHVLHDGHIADTHEVAAAKAEHFAAVAKVRAHGGYNHGGDYSDQYNQHSGASDAHNTLYHGSTAVPHILNDGHIADTHEVAAAKAQHYAVIATHGGYNHGGDYSGQYNQHSGASDAHNTPYHGSTTNNHILHDGYIADTHEVAAAKAQHLAAVATHGGYNHGGDYSNQYNHHSGASDAHNTLYHGPTAVPHVLPSGFIADTVEVSQAKQHHIHLLHSVQSTHE